MQSPLKCQQKNREELLSACGVKNKYTLTPHLDHSQITSRSIIRDKLESKFQLNGHYLTCCAHQYHITHGASIYKALEFY